MPNELYHLRPLIKDGTITVFGDLLDHVSLKDLAKAMGCSTKHVKYVKENPGKLRFGELIKLSEAVGMEYWKVGELFAE
jgi:hypothetical protein